MSVLLGADARLSEGWTVAYTFFFFGVLGMVAAFVDISISFVGFFLYMVMSQCYAGCGLQCLKRLY